MLPKYLQMAVGTGNELFKEKKYIYEETEQKSHNLLLFQNLIL
jgi:hypothetical protein